MPYRDSPSNIECQVAEFDPVAGEIEDMSNFEAEVAQYVAETGGSRMDRFFRNIGYNIMEGMGTCTPFVMASNPHFYVNTAERPKTH